MSVTDLLLEALDSLGNEDFAIFNWHLSTAVLDGCKPIPRHRLEDAKRTDTVTKLTQSYGDKTAVGITVKVLRKMNQNKAAQTLETAYRGSEEGQAASSTTRSSSAAAAAPSTLSADNGAVMFAPVLNNTTGTWNVTINKS